MLCAARGRTVLTFGLVGAFREGLDALEIDVCDLTGMGGNLVCCDGCPASYLAKSVGLKRFGDESQKWFCEECRVGGQTRSYRLANRLEQSRTRGAIMAMAKAHERKGVR